MAKKQPVMEAFELNEGAVLSASFFETKENRLWTLLLKGFIVYLLSMGSIGFYLSAFDIAFHVPLCHIMIFLMSMLCASLYYRLLTENLGYFLMFISFAGLVFVFKDYINSGFYAVVNITVDNAAQYFDVDIQKLYNERIGNRYVTVTFFTLFLGFVLDILLNVYISRRMQYVVAIGIVMALNLIPLYLTMEPDLLYSLMILSGIVLAIVFKAGRHYSPQVSVRRDNYRYKIIGKRKQEISYRYDVKAHAYAGGFAIVFVFCLVLLIGVIRPKERFNVGYQGNKYKDLTVAGMTTLLTDGWQGFYRSQDMNGGIQSGKLGDVSTIYLDHQTDLVVQMTPYSAKRLYLKNFTGTTYLPYANQWKASETEQEQPQGETQAMKRAYEQAYPYASKAQMKIQCVGVASDVYAPYYTDEVNWMRNQSTITYYPRLEKNKTSVESKDYRQAAYTDEDLEVPNENLEAVAQTVEKLGFVGKDETMIASLIAYYQDEIPYTIQPGRTPNKKDFVNYFLQENKKGYCAHFASAAVLIFRYLGIPARYVEGYAIDYDQMLDGQLVEESEYEDYYDGYSELGKTALLEIKVTDADAHAWVEVYSPLYGWYPVEVTPTGSDEEVTNFWEEFAEFMGDDVEESAQIQERKGWTFSDNMVRKTGFFVLIVVCLTVLIFVLRKLTAFIVYRIRFARADRNDRMILHYHRFMKKKQRKYPQLSKCQNYVDMLHTLRDQSINQKLSQELDEQMDDMVEILNQAGFSKKQITTSEYEFLVSCLRRFDKI